MLIISSKLGFVIRFDNVEELGTVTDTLIAFRNHIANNMIILPKYDLSVTENQLVGKAKTNAMNRFVANTGGILITDERKETKTKN